MGTPNINNPLLIKNLKHKEEEIELFIHEIQTIKRLCVKTELDYIHQITSMKDTIEYSLSSKERVINTLQSEIELMNCMMEEDNEKLLSKDEEIKNLIELNRSQNDIINALTEDVRSSGSSISSRSDDNDYYNDYIVEGL